MGRDLADAFPVARRVFEEADDRLGMALSRLCFEGPEEELVRTEHAQPAILAASIAAFRVLEDTAGLRPAALAGHSLGEWSALVAAGALALGDALVAVRERGRLMQEAVPAGEGAMAAVMGAALAEVVELCDDARAGDVLATANLNGAGQIVVAGHTAAVERLLALAAERRMRAQRLPVSAPFHCALMAPAAAGLARHLEQVRFAAPARAGVDECRRAADRERGGGARPPRAAGDESGPLGRDGARHGRARRDRRARDRAGPRADRPAQAHDRDVARCSRG
jgi:[acyl-carrier-protein] S-malonyltransferase